MPMELDEGLPGDPNKAALVAVSEATSIEEERATAESQAGFVVAKRFPRNSKSALNRVLSSCGRKTLAEQAEYVFPRGGQTVSGPSIRLAEAIAQNWGNIQFGIRELQQIEGASMLMAYCYDLETNTRAERIFTVKHVRKARGQVTQLTDPRDIYEMAFNQGARRLRACILQVIPGDVVELAVEACRATLAATDADTTPENIAKMLEAFKALDVTKEMIEARLGKKVEAIRPEEMVQLRKIFTSLNDGMSKVDQWFDVSAGAADLKEKLDQAAGKKTKAEAAKEEPKKAKKGKKTKKKAEKPPQEAEEPPQTASKPESEPEDEEPEEPSEGASEPSDDDFAASTLEIGPKPSQWNAQVEGLRTRALAAGITEAEWHEAVITIIGQLGYDNINNVAVSRRPNLKAALVALVEELEDQVDE